MELAKTIAQYGVIIVAIIALIGDRLKRKDTVKDKADDKADKLTALDTKVEKYKVETDKEILSVRRDMADMDERFQVIFTNVAQGNALLMAQSVDRISYRALKMSDGESVGADAYRNLNAEYQRLRDLVGDPDNPDIKYLEGLMKKVERLKIK